MVIGAVLADNQVHAQRAAKAVKVEYEELKPIITIEVSGISRLVLESVHCFMHQLLCIVI